LAREAESTERRLFGGDRIGFRGPVPVGVRQSHHLGDGLHPSSPLVRRTRWQICWVCPEKPWHPRPTNGRWPGSSSTPIPATRPRW